ncbi:MAG: hypothetical protein K1X55_10820 [Chitinophagales bacterium]|nr:hypothetical protein [Chitinophagales bacterium]
MRKLLFILFVIPFIQGCKQEDPIVLPFNDRLKVTSIYLLNPESGDNYKRWTTYFTYNQKGRITQQKEVRYNYQSNNSDSTTTHFEYPSNNKIKAWYSTDPQGVFLNEFYFYHRSGNLDTIETRLSIGGGSPFRSFAYNSDGELIKGLCFGNGLYANNDTMIYENGNLVKITGKREGAPEPYISGNIYTHEMEYYGSVPPPYRKFLQNINLSTIGDFVEGREIAADGLGLDVFSWYNFTGINWLGKHQNALIKRYRFSFDNIYYDDFSFSYEFDAKGRTTKKTTVNNAIGKVVRVTTYEYFN